MATTPRFFSVSDNSLATVGFPWVASIRSGLQTIASCRSCPRTVERPEGVVEAVLEPREGSEWPDVLGCGAWPLLIVSEQVLSAWQREGVGTFHHWPVAILDPLPKKLVRKASPDYFWIDGAQVRGASLDFDASGFVGVRFCPECSTRTDDIAATYDRQHAQVWPLVFRPGTWNGSNLFTTDISEAKFFCTDKVVECAAKHRLTNFRFIPVEDGAGTDSGGLEYM
jgi:hypothetical protein